MKSYKYNNSVSGTGLKIGMPIIKYLKKKKEIKSKGFSWSNVGTVFFLEPPLTIQALRVRNAKLISSETGQVRGVGARVLFPVASSPLSNIHTKFRKSVNYC